MSPEAGALPAATTRFAASQRSGVIAALRSGRGGAAGELVLYAGFRGRHWLRYERGAERRLPPADLYYLHSFEFYRAVAAAARRHDAKVIYDAHDFYRGIEPAAARSSFDRNHMRPFLNAREDEALSGADAIVTVSKGVAGLIERVGGRRPIVIRNCHDERLDRGPGSDLRNLLGLKLQERLCVVVGNRKVGMAVDAAIGALARLPSEFHLAFLGRGYEAVADSSTAANVKGRLHLGIVAAPNEVVPAIRSADIGLVLYEPYSENYRYAMPNGFFQVIAAGLPLVRGYLPEIEQTIGNCAVGECLDRLKPQELAEAIRRCSEDATPLRRNMAELAATLRWETELGRLRHLIHALPATRISA
jgi:glycosyltransferase involved in cell wall biosynthesis